MNHLRHMRSFHRSVIAVRKTFKSAFSSRYLLLTNTTLATLSTVGGDLLAQHYEILSGEEGSFNITRNLKVAVPGVLVGPIFHYWYLWLDRFLPGSTGRMLLKKVFTDMAVVPPIHIFVYIGSLGLMERESWKNIREEMMTKGKNLWLAEWLIWPPASAFGFYVLPTKMRVLFASAMSLLIDGYYSYVRFRDHQRGNEAVKAKTIASHFAQTDDTEQKTSKSLKIAKCERSRSDENSEVEK